MLIAPSPDPQYHHVTFSWSETEPDRAAHDVLVRLIALTDAAQDDGNLDPYLLERHSDGSWEATIRLPSDLRTMYQLCPVRDAPLRGREVDDERWAAIMAAGTADPSNPASIGPCTYGNAGLASVLELPEAVAQPWHARHADVPRGEVTRHELESANHDEPSVVFVYAPPGYDPDGDPLPLAVLFDGRWWMILDVAATFDNLIADGVVPPLLALIVESIHGATRLQSLTRPGLFLPFLLEEALPFVSARWNATADPAETMLAGQSLGGLAATHAVLAAPDRFGAILGQSSSFWWPGSPEGELAGDDVIEAYATRPAAPTRLFLEAGLGERRVLEQNRRMRDVLEARDYDLTYREYQGGHDHACWRGGLADGLITLLGRTPPDRPRPARSP